MWTADEREHGLRMLRRILEETRGMPRRAFLERLGAATAGSAVLGALAPALGGRADAQIKPVTTIGWGGAWQDAATLDPVDLLSTADRALYMAKDEGRDRVRVWP